MARSFERAIFQLQILCLLVLINCISSVDSRFIGILTNISKTVNVNPEESYSCKRKCYEQYNRCARASAAYEELIGCMKTKSNCMRRCRDRHDRKT